MKLSFGLIVSFFLTFSTHLLAIELNLTPKSGNSDGTFSNQTVQGRAVWVANSGYLYFDVPTAGWFTVGTPVYVRIEYLDTGAGTLGLHYDSNYGDTTGDKFKEAEFHTRSTRLNSGEFVYSFRMLNNPRFANRENGSTDFRLRFSNTAGVPFQIASLTLSTEPFNDARFLQAIQRPWLNQQTSPAKDLVDNRTLAGKVMTGYQGWFRTPSDVEDGGWRHWGRSSSVAPSPSEITIDMWPYLDDYQPEDLYRAGQMTHQSGRPAYLFSSADVETVRRHFQWMRKYNIDGAYLQRFVTRSGSGYYGAKEYVLSNVREAAATEGRIWAIEYDISSLETNKPLEVITNDWNFLVNDCGILSDPRYAHENGRPVLFIWGFSVTDRPHTLAQADSIVNYFKTNKWQTQFGTMTNLYLIGGAGSRWDTNTVWRAHYQKYDQMLAWMQRTRSRLDSQKTLLESWGAKILPHAWPGFSWNNLKMTQFPTSYTARNGGRFYWTNLYNAASIGADQIFLGMFDEYDEGTAIMPMSDDHPDIYNGGGTNTWGHYIDNEGRDPFWYLRLSGAAHEMLNGQRAISSTLPSTNSLYEVHCGGEFYTSMLGATNVMEQLTHPQGGDGNTTPALIAGKDCRVNVNTTSDLYFYFNIDDALCFANTNGQQLTIELEYYGNTNGSTFSLHYDSTANAFSNHPALITAPSGSKGWKLARWTVTNGFFGNRQQGVADFRIALSSGTTSAIRRVTLTLPEYQNRAVSDESAQIQLSEGTLTWSDRLDASGWRLKEATSLVNPVWKDVPGSLIFTNGTVQSGALFTNASRFYRLERPAKP